MVSRAVNSHSSAHQYELAANCNINQSLTCFSGAFHSLAPRCLGFRVSKALSVNWLLSRALPMRKKRFLPSPWIRGTGWSCPGSTALASRKIAGTPCLCRCRWVMPCTCLLPSTHALPGCCLAVQSQQALKASRLLSAKHEPFLGLPDSSRVVPEQG